MATETPDAGLRSRTHEILEAARPGDRASLIADAILIVLVTSNVLAVMLESIEELGMTYGDAFAAFEVFSVAVFTLEYGLRVWSCTAAEDARGPTWRVRLRFCTRPMAVLDLVAFLPFYLMMWLPLDLRFLRVLRLLRAFKLTRYSAAMRSLLGVLRREARVFGAAGFLLITTMVIAASGIYLVEHHAQPEAFASIPASMWWAVTTLTTVGYGDVTPITPAGKLFASVITILGVVVVAMPAGILASGFSAEVRLNEAKFRREVDHALEDGVIDGSEASTLQTLSHELGLAEAETRELIASAIEARSDECPHCGKALSS